MTMIYLYAVADPTTLAPAGPGLDGRSLRLLTTAGLTAIYSEHAELSPAATPEAAWAHERVTEQAMQHGALLPARFGSTFRSIAALEQVLADEADRLKAALDRVRGCVELAVRVSFPATVAPEGGRSGSAYVQEKLAARRHEEAIAARTLEPLEELAVTSTGARRDRRSATTLSAAYLVGSDEVARFAGAVARLQRAEPELTVTCTGPWAPYSFVDGAPA
jgi:hypothetical protein